jgi:exodeoxyribonuclease VII large subunit
MRWMKPPRDLLFSSTSMPQKPAPDNEFQPPPSASVGAPAVWTVSELNRRVKGSIEAAFELRWVRGELSNVVRAASGHWYFSLKDDAAQVRCVMFKGRAQAVNFAPANGIEVEVRALPTLYEARGDFQLGVEAMRRAGVGALHEAFERLKRKLDAEGLFDAAQKRPPPAFARRIGIVTSLKAAALRDVLTTFRRRAPMIEIIIYPAAVQGADAVPDLVAAIDNAAARNEIDALLICRGGGAMEDLWAFNEEPVARAIAAFRMRTHLPVVSGVGHETDFTITDFVADVRAPTPTAGAELLSPDIRQLRAERERTHQRLQRAIQSHFAQWQQRLDLAVRAVVSPSQRLEHERALLQSLRHRIQRCQHWQQSQYTTRLDGFKHRLERAKPSTEARRQLVASLAGSMQRSARIYVANLHVSVAQQRQALTMLDPAKVMTRGYAVVRRADATGAVVTSAAALKPGSAIAVQFSDGQVSAEVTKTGS